LLFIKNSSSSFEKIVAIQNAKKPYAATAAQDTFLASFYEFINLLQSIAAHIFMIYIVFILAQAAAFVNRLIS